MSKYYIFYNPNSGNSNKKSVKEILDEVLKDNELIYADITAVENMQETLKTLDPELNVVLTGGDGTLQHFINNIDCNGLERKVYYWGYGSGNDFLYDIGIKQQTELVELNKYIKNLPVVEFGSKICRFINSTAYGVDGFCCLEGDRLRRITKKTINYTTIALKSFIYAYKPVDAVISVDGVEKEYKNVWLASVMNSRYYGGGMLAAPMQERLGKDKKLTMVIVHCKHRIPALLSLTSFFDGSHVNKPKLVTILQGKQFSVTYKTPKPIGIDGEPFDDIPCYRAHA